MAGAGVMVVFREERSARRALAAAAELGEPVTVVALAPRTPRHARCVTDAGALDDATRAAAERELEHARELLGEHAAAAEFAVVAPRSDADVVAWARGAGLRTALIGARSAVLGLRLRDPLARALARGGIDVRVVD